MAETLEEFNFGRLRRKGSGVDYKTFMDGQIWKLASEDSPTGTAALLSMQTRLANIAREMGLSFRSNIIREEVNPDDFPDGTQLVEVDDTFYREYIVMQATESDEDE